MTLRYRPPFVSLRQPLGGGDDSGAGNECANPGAGSGLAMHRLRGGRNGGQGHVRGERIDPGSGASLADRLQEIFAGVDKLANQYQPDEVAIERVFMHRNADSALKLGQARGRGVECNFCRASSCF